MKTLRIIKKSADNDSCAVVAIEEPLGFAIVTRMVCLMTVSVHSQVGDTMNVPKKYEISVSDKEVAEGDLSWARITLI